MGEMMITPTTDPCAATLSPVERPTRHWRHVGRGSEYVEIGRGLLQQSGRSLFENDVIVAYRGSDGKIWFREQGEFEDGRFVEISPAEPSVTPAPIEPGVIEALEIIAGKRQCIDNLMSHADVARAALASLAPAPTPAIAEYIERRITAEAPAPAAKANVTAEYILEYMPDVDDAGSRAQDAAEAVLAYFRDPTIADLPYTAPAPADPCLQGPGTTPPFAIPRDPNFHAPAPADTVPMWRDMSSAPKDGTWVLLWWPHWHHAPITGYYDMGWVADRAISDGPDPLAWQPLHIPSTAEIDRLLAKGARG